MEALGNLFITLSGTGVELGPDFYIAELARLGIFGLLAQSLAVQWRAGVFSLGQGTWFCIGAYVTAIWARRWYPDAMSVQPLHPWLPYCGLLCGSLCCVVAFVSVFSYFLGSKLAKLREDYFAVATLVISQIVLNVVSNVNAFGQGEGIQLPLWVNSSMNSSSMEYSAIFAVLSAVLNCGFLVLMLRLRSSARGLQLVAIGDDEYAASLLGIDVPRLKTALFSICSVAAASAGWLLACYTTYVGPDDFAFSKMLPVMLAGVVGRPGTTKCLVAIVLIFAVEQSINLKFLGLLGPKLSDILAVQRDVIFAACLILSVWSKSLLKSNRIRLTLLVNGDSWQRR